MSLFASAGRDTLGNTATDGFLTLGYISRGGGSLLVVSLSSGPFFLAVHESIRVIAR